MVSRSHSEGIPQRKCHTHTELWHLNQNSLDSLIYTRLIINTSVLEGLVTRDLEKSIS